MNNKWRIVWRVVLSILGLGFLGALAYGGWFYYTYLRGAPAAISEPPQRLIEEVTTPVPTDIGDSLPFLTVPEGFIVQQYASGMDKPRDLAQDPDGTILVSDFNAGIVYALIDEDGDGYADENRIVADQLNRPHGLAFYCEVDPCQLYIAETGMVTRWDYDVQTKRASNRQDLAGLPSGGRHSTRSILFLLPPNQNTLLVSIGSSCDTCVEADSRRASVIAMDADGSNVRPYSDGLRNAVFLASHPRTGEAWVTEMGRDFLGDDLPPDEINILKEGKNFGWPYCYGNNVHDTRFDPNGPDDRCNGRIPSHIDLQAHSAPLGLDFFPREGWPQQYHDDLLVAYHGSWNRTVPTGYKIMRFTLDAQGNYEAREDFITGWLTENGQSIGRPADVLIEPNGQLFISDDKAGVVYRAVLMGDSQ